MLFIKYLNVYLLNNFFIRITVLNLIVYVNFNVLCSLLKRLFFMRLRARYKRLSLSLATGLSCWQIALHVLQANDPKKKDRKDFHFFLCKIISNCTLLLWKQALDHNGASIKSLFSIFFNFINPLRDC